MRFRAQNCQALVPNINPKKPRPGPNQLLLNSNTQFVSRRLGLTLKSHAPFIIKMSAFRKDKLKQLNKKDQMQVSQVDKDMVK